MFSGSHAACPGLLTVPQLLLLAVKYGHPMSQEQPHAEGRCASLN